LSVVLGLTPLLRMEKECALLEVPVESCPSSLPHLAVRACGRSNKMILTGILPTYAYVKTAARLNDAVKGCRVVIFTMRFEVGD